MPSIDDVPRLIDPPQASLSISYDSNKNNNNEHDDSINKKPHTNRPTRLPSETIPSTALPFRGWTQFVHEQHAPTEDGIDKFIKKHRKNVWTPQGIAANVLYGMENAGNWVASLIGMHTPQYQYIIHAYERHIQQEEEEKMQQINQHENQNYNENDDGNDNENDNGNGGDDAVSKVRQPQPNGTIDLEAANTKTEDMEEPSNIDVIGAKPRYRTREGTTLESD